MKNTENWENMNAEDLTAEENVTVIDETDDNDSKPTVPTTTGNDTEESESAETDDTSVPEEEMPDDESAITEEVSSDSDSQVAEGEKEKTKKKMKRREFITLIISGIVLALLLLALLFWINSLRQRSTTLRNDGDTSITVVDPDGDDQSRDENDSQTGGSNGTGVGDENSDRTDGDGSLDENDKTNNGSTGKNPGDENQNSSGGNKTDDNEDGDKNNGIENGNGQTGNGDDDDSDDNGNTNQDNGNNKNPSNGDDKQNENNGDNNITQDYTGEVNVSVSGVDASSGIITVTIEGKSVVIPVQSTSFNGRITKSGVAKAELFGYNSAITVMLFYPEDEGFTYQNATGYMSRNGDSLTVLVDLNGNGSKLLIKVNGMKSLF